MKDIIMDMYLDYFPSNADKITGYQVSKYKSNIYYISYSDGKLYMYNYVAQNARTRITDIEAEEKWLKPFPTDDIWKGNFKDRLNKRMNELGYIPIDLAEKTGLSRALIFKYISGKSIPGSINLDKIARALKCEMNYFSKTE